MLRHRGDAVLRGGSSPRRGGGRAALPTRGAALEAATVEDARHGAVWRWRGRLRTSPPEALATAQAALALHGMTALLRTAPGGRAILLAAPTPPLPRRRQAPGAAPGGMRRTVARAATAVGLAGSMPPPRRPVRPPRRLTRRGRCGIISMYGAGAPPIRRRILKHLLLAHLLHYYFLFRSDEG